MIYYKTVLEVADENILAKLSSDEKSFEFSGAVRGPLE
jgi:hypothetical protein